MKLLLDTHTFIWFCWEPERLPFSVRDEIESAGLDAAVSIVSLWEIAIKTSIQKLAIPAPFDELFPASISESGLSLLPIEVSDLKIVAQLPWHHRDPFDRVLAAQALSKSLNFATLDSIFESYGVKTIW